MGIGRNGKLERNPTTFKSLLPPLGVPSLQELNCLSFSKSKPKLSGSCNCPWRSQPLHLSTRGLQAWLNEIRESEGTIEVQLPASGYSQLPGTWLRQQSCDSALTKSVEKVNNFFGLLNATFFFLIFHKCISAFKLSWGLRLVRKQRRQPWLGKDIRWELTTLF